MGNVHFIIIIFIFSIKRTICPGAICKAPHHGPPIVKAPLKCL